MPMKKSLWIVSLLSFVVLAAYAQGPNHSGKYYKLADGLKGEELKTALFNIIRDPSVVSYDGLKLAYIKTDTRPDGFLRDFYSNITNYVPGSDMAAGEYEGFNYNREHTVCQSWFKSVSPMYSDVVMVIPTDGYINSRRNNNPFGEVTDQESQIKTSQNGYSKWGAPRNGLGQPEKVTTVFEPNDEVKGDIARIYFYMATCYQDRATTFVNGTGQYVFNAEGTTYQPLQEWVFNMMLRWAKLDPVDEIEISRNNAVKEVQGNRNPFVDYPGLEDYIWGDKKEVAFSYDYYEGVKQGDEDEPDPDVEPIGEEASIALNSVFFNCDWNGSRPTGQGAPTQLTGTLGNVTVVYAKGSSGQTMYCNDKEIRMYKYNTLAFRISGDDFTKITLNVKANANNKKFLANNVELEGYEWTGDADEVVFKLSDTDKGNVSITGAVLHTPTGIWTVPIDNYNVPEAIYSIDGRRLEMLQPGLNIIRMKNGQVKKVFIH